MKAKYRVGIVTASPLFSEAKPTIEPQLKLIHILEPLSEKIVWVATNCADIKHRIPPKVTVLNIDFPYYLRQRDKEDHFFTKLFFFLVHQVKIIFALFKLRKELNIIVFACGADLFAFPMLFGKLFGKRIIIRSSGRPSTILGGYYQEKSRYKIALFHIAEKTSYLLANKLLPESLYMVDLYNLHKYQRKIADGSLYVDTPFLGRSKKLAERKFLIGYVGRFSEEKGVLEFAQSLPFLLKGEHAQAIIIGNGKLKGDIEQILIRGNVQNRVKFTGWIQHEELPAYLNEIKIVIVPSYKEGLPNLVLEAMGSGCIVVATPVGGIPGVINDSKTGFIMENNSPDCIVKNVIRAFSHPDLDALAENARAFIESKYTYEAVVERYRNILTGLEEKDI